LLDVLEQVGNPERFLDQLRASSRSHDGTPKLLITTGNVVFWIVRLQAFMGNFNYGKRGILDRSHSRLYTFRSLQTLLRQCGFKVERVEGIPAPFPVALGLNWYSRALTGLNLFLIRISRGFFSFQILVVASPIPTLDALRDRTVESSAARAATIEQLIERGK
jgi:hypothetical protein